MMCVEPVMTVFEPSTASRQMCAPSTTIEREPMKQLSSTITGAACTGSTHIIDVTGPEPVTYKGYVPARSVVVPGSYRKQFPAGEYSVSCALIIGRRKESTDKKTSLNDALRDFGVPV